VGDPTFIIEVGITQAQPTDITVQYSLVANNATEGVDFAFTGSKDIVIAAGQYIGQVELQVFDDAAANGVRTLDFEITGVSGGSGLTIDALVEEGDTKKTVVIIDDDCALDLSSFVGTFNVNEDNGAFLYTTGVSLGSSANTLLVDNWWGSGLAAEVTFDNSDPASPKAFVLPQDAGAVLCCGANAWVTSRPDPAASGSAPARAGVPDGTFSTCNTSFEVDIYIYIPALGTFNSSTPVNHVFTK